MVVVIAAVDAQRNVLGITYEKTDIEQYHALPVKEREIFVAAFFPEDAHKLAGLLLLYELLKQYKSVTMRDITKMFETINRMQL
jgi:hypothetical protein